MNKEIQVVEVDVPIERVPTFKKAAKAGEIDFTDNPNADGQTIRFHMFLLGNYDLFEMGYAAGINKMYDDMAGPLKEVMDGLQNKIDKFKQDEQNS